ncbi:hypothetical protein KG088_16985 [Halomonas sp. TRM85114]|uniref:hypothetical protein n=1 Tax=Halomonas jincaotanensis TaxID=2810616 RepID=UPI001BD5EE21|nr:hypothetical protein [Halomonas jincaotanensis]MBS9405313.1 hypothetical protein [Halomonas jincaotanensis]
MTVQAIPLHRKRETRLLAFLLALLLSVTSLVGHAAMDACASDCTTAQVEMVDNPDHECSACATLVATPIIASKSLDPLAEASHPAVVEYIHLPPRQPPRP